MVWVHGVSVKNFHLVRGSVLNMEFRYKSRFTIFHISASIRDGLMKFSLHTQDHVCTTYKQFQVDILYILHFIWDFVKLVLQKFWGSSVEVLQKFCRTSTELLQNFKVLQNFHRTSTELPQNFYRTSTESLFNTLNSLCKITVYLVDDMAQVAQFFIQMVIITAF